MSKNPETSSPALDTTLEKISQRKPITRRQLLNLVAGASAVALGTALGIKISSEDELPSIPVDSETSSSSPSSNVELTSKPEISTKIKEILREINLKSPNQEHINVHFDRVTSIVSKLSVVTPEEFKLNEDSSLYLVVPKPKIGMSNEEYKKTVQNPEYVDDVSGIKYVSDLINELLRANLIPQEISDTTQLSIFLKNNPSIFYAVPNFEDFSRNFKATLSDYAHIVISNGKVSFIYGLKNNDTNGVVPVVTTTGQDSCVEVLNKDNFLNMRNSNSVYFRMRV